MVRPIPVLMIFVLFLGIGHLLTLQIMPTLIMNRGIDVLTSAGAVRNAWYTAPRIEDSRDTIVRPSPDLAYSVCVIDLSDGPVRIKAPGWDGYGSLAIFNSDSQNVFVGGLQDKPSLELVVGRAQHKPEHGEQARWVELVGNTGVALIRRLAPRRDLHEQSVALMEQAVCEPA